MTVPVRLQDLRAELERRGHGAYLLTVGDDGRPHCVAVFLAWDDDELVMRAGRTSARNAGARGGVTVVVPPPHGPAGARDDDPASSEGGSVGGYTLIVDGEADVPPDAAQGGMLRLRATHAVLHRPASGLDNGPAHDCVHVLEALPPT